MKKSCLKSQTNQEKTVPNTEYTVHCATETHDMIKVWHRSCQAASGGKDLSNSLGKDHLKWLISIKSVSGKIICSFFQKQNYCRKMLDSKHLFYATVSWQTHQTITKQNRSLARSPLSGDRKWNIMPSTGVFHFGPMVSKQRVNIRNAEQPKSLKRVPNSTCASDNFGMRQCFWKEKNTTGCCREISWCCVHAASSDMFSLLSNWMNEAI